MKAVIFAGGVGTRLWPLSRQSSPKQFEKIIGNKSTLQHTVDRLLANFDWQDIYVSTGRRYEAIVQKQLPELPPNHVIGEPEMRDVGPAVGLMTALLAKDSLDEPMLIVWSDHLVKKEALFKKIITVAGEVINEYPDRIVFISQSPRFASENLGWIEYSKKSLVKTGIAIYSFVGFQYRPDKKTAKRYFESGHHAWNLGYFVTTPRFLWRQYQRLVPHMYQKLSQIKAAWRTSRFAEVLDQVYPTLEKIHFDNAILEKLDPSQAWVISENIGWSDVGAWEALKEALQEAENKNVVQGKVMLTDTQDSLVYNYTDQMVVTIDLQSMLVVSTPDVLLVCSKDSVPKIKQFVNNLKGTENEKLM